MRPRHETMIGLPKRADVSIATGLFIGSLLLLGPWLTHRFVRSTLEQRIHLHRHRSTVPRSFFPVERPAIWRLALPFSLSADASDLGRPAAFPLHRACVSPGERDRICACAGVLVHSRTAVVPLAIAAVFAALAYAVFPIAGLPLTASARAGSSLCERALELRSAGCV